MDQSARPSYIYGDTGYTGAVIVDGNGSELDDSGSSVVIYGSGTLSVLDGATMSAGLLMSDDFGSGDGTVTVDGAQSQLNLSTLLADDGTITVSNGATLSLGLPDEGGGEFDFGGDTGSATLVVETGGTITDNAIFDPNTYCAFGVALDSQGKGTITGEGSLLDLENAPIFVGLVGNGTLSVTAGALAIGDEIDIGVFAGSQGTITVDGANSLLSANILAVGGTGDAAGGTGVLNISGGAVVDASVVQVWGSGSVNLSGGELDTDPVTISAGGIISGNGIISGDITNGGTIIASGGTLELTDAITGSGTLIIDPGAGTCSLTARSIRAL